LGQKKKETQEKFAAYIALNHWNLPFENGYGYQMGLDWYFAPRLLAGVHFSDCENKLSHPPNPDFKHSGFYSTRVCVRAGVDLVRAERFIGTVHFDLGTNNMYLFNYDAPSIYHSSKYRESRIAQQSFEHHYGYCFDPGVSLRYSLFPRNSEVGLWLFADFTVMHNIKYDTIYNTTWQNQPKISLGIIFTDW
jgi:hypothetical protein